MKAAIIGYGKSGAAAEKLLRLKCFESIDILMIKMRSMQILQNIKMNMT